MCRQEMSSKKYNMNSNHHPQQIRITLLLSVITLVSYLLQMKAPSSLRYPATNVFIAHVQDW